jgi:hypothetical protein
MRYVWGAGVKIHTIYTSAADGIESQSHALPL